MKPITTGEMSNWIREQIEIDAWEKYQPQPWQPIRVSEMQQCPRFLAYKWRGIEIDNPFDAVTIEKLEKGNLLQDRIRGHLIPRFSTWHVTHWKPEKLLKLRVSVAFKELGLTDQEYDHKVDAFLTFQGHPDGGLYVQGDDTQREILEVKTTSSYGYKSIKKAGFVDPTNFSYGYYSQANTYAHFWNILFPHTPVSGIRFFLYNVNGDRDKDSDAPYFDWRFPLSPDRFREDMIRVATLRIRAQEEPEWLPEKGYALSDWHCKGCLYCHTCWGLRRCTPRPRSTTEPIPLEKVVGPLTKRALPRRLAGAVPSTKGVLGQDTPKRGRRKTSSRKSAPATRKRARRKGVA